MFPGFETTLELPWIFSFIVKKRRQVDNLMEVPKDKRPPDYMIWWGTPEEMETWLDRMFDHDENKPVEEFSFIIPEENIE